MDDTVKTVVYSVIGIVVGVCVISAGWLIRENRRMYANYLKEKYLWYEKNRDLEFKLDQFKAELDNFQEKFKHTQVYITRLEEEKKMAEEKLQQLAEENEKLRTEVTRLAKENQGLEEKLKRYTQNSQPVQQDEFWSNLLRDKANLELRLNSLERLLSQKDELIQNFEQERKNLHQTLEKLRDDKKQLEVKIADIKKIVADLSSSLEQEKKEKLHYVEEMQRLEAQNKEFAGRLEKIKQEKETLEKKIAELNQQLMQAQQEKQEYSKRLAGINQILEDKMLEVTKLKQDLEIALENVKKLSYGLVSPEAVKLPKIEVKSQTLEGKILRVDPDNGFVIVDLGKRDGITEGMKCNVYREGKLIAKLEVIKAEEVTSAARIINGLPQEPVIENDSVVFLK
jgi:chromosome segregation ATPase